VPAIQLEDQVFPKRCGHMLGRKVIAMEEMVQKIKAATDVRQDEDFVIIARTDARTNYGLEEALRRGQAYRDAGADVIFIESPEGVEELKAINEAFPGTSTLANVVEGGRTPMLPAEELETLGFALAIYPIGPLYAATKAVKDYLAELKAAGTAMDWIDHMISFEDFNQLIGLPEYNRLEERYKVQEV
jgi:2-methylisocitrate lyase-like PEP mutase family enzyme